MSEEHPQQFTDPSAPHHGERHVRTPTDELSHEGKLARQHTHITVLSAALILVLLMLAYAAAFDLDTVYEWIVLGAVCFTAVGVLVAVQSRNN